MKAKSRNIFANLSPLDHRYSRKEETFNILSNYFSEESRLLTEARVEAALVETLHDFALAPAEAVSQVKKAAEEITAAEVYQEEEKTHHNTRALVNCLREKVAEEYRQYIHLGATSYDIIDTGAVIRYRNFTKKALLPKLLELLELLITVAEREKNTPQVGRTHGQQAVPLTFGCYLSGFISRLGRQIENILTASQNLKGKFSGAVGAYNALNLLVDDPVAFEKSLLAKLDLEPAEHSTQILPPEYFTNFFHSLVVTFGILADLSDDMRHLQRSEISEVGEAFTADQVGSSTMPQKRNPINFENVKGSWKNTFPKMMTIYQDQLSEHQRDLTNSTTSRYYPEIPIALYLAGERLEKVFARFVVDDNKMLQNLQKQQDLLSAEPLYILLARAGHPDAHEAVRRLTLQAEKKLANLSKEREDDDFENANILWQLAQEDESLSPYLDKFSPEEKRILKDPAHYLGKSALQTTKITSNWKDRLTEIKTSLTGD